MELAQQLTMLRRELVTIEFSDGEILEARLLNVDTVEHDDVVLDVKSVLKSTSGRKYKPNEYYRAAIDTIRSVTRVARSG